MEIAKRITTLIEILGLSPGEFADKISVQRSGISHITSGRNKPSLDFLERTLSVFPEINSDWLILGKGKPLKSQSEQKITSVNDPVVKENDLYNQSPLLFPMDGEEVPVYDENNIKNIDNKEVNKYLELDSFTKPTKNVGKEKEEVPEQTGKKEVKKIIILYTDNSFEVYDS